MTTRQKPEKRRQKKKVLSSQLVIRLLYSVHWRIPLEKGSAGVRTLWRIPLQQVFQESVSVTYAKEE